MKEVITEKEVKSCELLPVAMFCSAFKMNSAADFLFFSLQVFVVVFPAFVVVVFVFV